MTCGKKNNLKFFSFFLFFFLFLFCFFFSFLSFDFFLLLFYLHRRPIPFSLHPFASVEQLRALWVALRVGDGSDCNHRTSLFRPHLIYNSDFFEQHHHLRKPNLWPCFWVHFDFVYIWLCFWACSANCGGKNSLAI